MPARRLRFPIRRLSGVLLGLGWLAVGVVSLAPAELGAKAGQSERRSGPRKKPTIETQYKQATAAYQGGKFAEAARAFRAILKAYPGHEPSRIHLGRCLYRLERIADAYQVFSGVTLDSLDPETSYEYAQASMSQRQWEAALEGFKRIPKGHPLSDLAGYYGAITALNLKRYAQAEVLIDNAVVLPTKLIKSRDTYKKTIVELRHREEREQIERQKASDIEAMKHETKQIIAKMRDPKTAKERGDGESRAQTPDDGPEAPGFIQIPRELGLGSDFSLTTFNYNGRRQDQARSIANYAWITLAPKPPSPTSGLALTARAENRAKSGQEPGLSPGQTEISLKEAVDAALPLSNDRVRIGILDLKAWTEAPIHRDFHLGLAGRGYAALADFRSDQSVTAGGGEAFASLAAGDTELKASAGSYQVWGTNRLQLKSWLEGRVALSTPLISDTSLVLGGTAVQYRYQNALAEGPDFDFGASAKLAINLPRSTLLGTEGLYLYSRGFRITQLAIADFVTFDQTSLTGRAFFEWRATSWFRLEASGFVLRRRFEKLIPGDSDVTTSLEEAWPNFVSKSQVLAEVAVPF